jgi:diguanylate cyclase (GGDEF)-like protein
MAIPRPIAAANVAALVGASAATAAVGLTGPAAFALPAAGAVVAWAGIGTIPLGPVALAAALPAMALLPGGGWVALGGWSAAGIAVGLGAQVLRELRRRAALTDLHNELREAAHERGILERNIERYPVLLEACLQLSNAREPDPLAQVLCERARQLVPEANEVLVYLGTPSKQSCRASSDRHGKACPRDATAEHLFVAAEARSLTRREGNLLRVLIPLRSERRQQESGEALRGVLEVALVFSEVGERMSIELLHALGRLGGLGLATVDLVNQARSLALHDDLTGLYGQHEFWRRLEEQVAHARRYKHPLGVVMCDMDHLKKYNDRFGHPAGDAALKAVAKAILETLPPGGMACRYGGEEFAALTPEVDETELREYAEKLRHAIASAVPDPAHKDRKVTASIGYAVVRQGESGREALERADAAGYRAKANGRNRVEAAA